MINIKNLNFGYKKKELLFSNLNLNLEKGKVYGLLGKNGSGKTTLLKQITGLLHPQSGEIKIDGISAKTRSAKLLSKYYMLPEEFDTPSLSVNDFININAAFYKNFDTNIFNQNIEAFNIPAHSKLSKMSFGQKKKVLIAFALAVNTDILFADEPTNGLDIPSKSIFRKLMVNAINNKRIFVISTHQVKDIDGIFDALVVLNNGKIIFNQSIENINQKICFKQTDTDNLPDILYSEKYLNTYQSIVKNTENEYSNINTELLFNALVSDKNKKIIELFN